MEFDILYMFHFVFLMGIFTIPLWSIKYLRWGVYIPFIIATSWVVFYGCPITHIQKNLQGDTFVHNLLSHIDPTISVQQSDHIIFFLFMVITIVGFIRLCPSLL